jgi:hypothetical protein
MPPWVTTRPTPVLDVVIDVVYGPRAGTGNGQLQNVWPMNWVS